MEPHNPSTSHSNTHAANDDRVPLSRRRFLELTAVSIAGTASVASQATRALDPELAVPPGAPRARVVEIHSADVVSESIVHPAVLREMIATALVAVTQTKDVNLAWKALLSPNDIVGLKFNRSGSSAIGTSEHVARALVESLISAGWPADQIVCIEAPHGFVVESGTLPPAHGFDPAEVKFGSGRDQLAAVLNQITAIIDVPFLKTHNIAGLTCCLKNLSHGLVKHPARYHDHGCSPFIADIVNLDQIRGKLRLCLVDALRPVFDGGPQPTTGAISNAGILLASVDPVAADTVGLAHLNQIRQSEGLDPIARSAAEIPYLLTAHRKGLGIAALHAITIDRRIL